MGTFTGSTLRVFRAGSLSTKNVPPLVLHDARFNDRFIHGSIEKTSRILASADGHSIDACMPGISLAAMGSLKWSPGAIKEKFAVALTT